MKTYRDYYFRKAKAEHYPARSVYKLQEMDKALRILRPGQRVLDLGATPGSWTLYAAERVGPKGQVVAVDLNPTDTAFPPQVCFLVTDMLAPAAEVEGVLAQAAPFAVVLSDMAPKTTGSRITDQSRSLALVEAAYTVAMRWLGLGGHFVAKIFEGPDAPGFVRSIKPFFERVSLFKPKSSRSESKEIFIVGLGLRERDPRYLSPHHEETHGRT
ncbi:MAG: rRNA methyltransferase [Desulfomicrobiaceae bacterium]|jgi:23S rRNA (uridine2552-2'-O)-methyltransferase|nr:RlmE family RNA methyltransferase [Desulfomicrobiaceae bacterium]MBZ4648268.1 rRNA methyltransferase [Desulfomicrobiaceae bacterium]MBZ4685576.1 rRNA methyltransferase [Desulfomicrobiaceae bacterium]MDK2872856.1 rRNA (uridine2552-2-O)-methyltransferase [Desulfomicrobiaceae bacterium]HCF05651.1 50S rRNA methyltransferase [Desulfomicrobiaceae bacterium]